MEHEAHRRRTVAGALGVAHLVERPPVEQHTTAVDVVETRRGSSAAWSCPSPTVPSPRRTRRRRRSGRRRATPRPHRRRCGRSCAPPPPRAAARRRPPASPATRSFGVTTSLLTTRPCPIRRRLPRAASPRSRARRRRPGPSALVPAAGRSDIQGRATGTSGGTAMRRRRQETTPSPRAWDRPPSPPYAIVRVHAERAGSGLVAPSTRR